MKRLVLAGIVLVVIVGCSRPERRPREMKELETVDVGEGYDAQLSTDADQRERRAEAGLGGVLPSDFPSEMPIFSPASIVDFGGRAGAGGFVEVDTAVPLAEVKSSLTTLVRRAGWDVEPTGEGGSIVTRGGQRITVRLTDLGSGTRIRYEY